MNDADKLAALETYFRLMSMKGAVEVYHAARAAGVLDVLGAGPALAEDIAARCGLDARAAGLLLDALCAAGVAERSGDSYHAALVLQFLSGTYRDLSAQYWAHLPDFLRTGRPMQHMDDAAEGPRAYAAQAAALHGMMLPSATASG